MNVTSNPRVSVQELPFALDLKDTSELISDVCKWILQLNGSSWKVQGGRRDGCVSRADSADSEIPSPDLDLDGLTASFNRKGLSRDQMVILSGTSTSIVLFSCFRRCFYLQARTYITLVGLCHETHRRCCLCFSQEHILQQPAIAKTSLHDFTISTRLMPLIRQSLLLMRPSWSPSVHKGPLTTVSLSYWIRSHHSSTPDIMWLSNNTRDYSLRIKFCSMIHALGLWWNLWRTTSCLRKILAKLCALWLQLRSNYTKEKFETTVAWSIRTDPVLLITIPL